MQCCFLGERPCSDSITFKKLRCSHKLARHEFKDVEFKQGILVPATSIKTVKHRHESMRQII